MDNEEKDTVDTELEQSNIEETNSVEENTINNELNEEVSDNRNDIADLIEETPQDNNPLPPTEEVKETREDKHKGKDRRCRTHGDTHGADVYKALGYGYARFSGA